ncbi:MAG TPA: potassium channel protein [Candidatus Dormibacteraeota bacterium]|nr:potassium channel protein [Candidatus Dormibacteraeota bacterium]
MSSSHVANPLLRFRLPAVLLAVVIAIGITGYALIDRWDFLDSFYMTIITISTVGYTEVHPQGTAGRIFTSALIVIGVGTMLFGFGVFAEALTENNFGTYRRQRQLERQLDHLRDHFIICGYGRIGTQVAIEFEDHKVPYAVIEQNPEALERLHNESRLHIEGDAASEEILKRAGIERARGLISAVDSDERSVYITLSARALNPGLFIISRGGRPDSTRRLELAGANRVISPYRMAGHRMAELAVHPALVDVLDTLHHGGSEIGVEEILVGPTTTGLGKSLTEAGLLDPSGAKVLALRRRDGTLHPNPTGDLRLEEGDLVIALGTESQLVATAAALR